MGKIIDIFQEMVDGIFGDINSGGHSQFRLNMTLCVLPNLIGLILGCVLAYKLSLGGTVTIIFGLAGSVLFGFFRSNGFRNYPVIQALRMNAVLSLMIILLYVIFKIAKSFV